MPDPHTADDDPPPTGDAGGGGPDPADRDDEELAPDEAELLAAFDRLRPQGGLQWGFDDAMRRIAEPDTSSIAGVAPWKGLPDDLWDRGRSARIGRRFGGDVAGVLADLLAADARAAAGAAVADVNEATWDALRYLAARVDLLEARLDPTGLEPAELPMGSPDVGEWADVIGSWVGPPGPEGTVVVGESGDGTLVRALSGAGHRVLGVEPRGASVWASRASPGGDGSSSGTEIVIGEVLDHLRACASGSAPAVVLAGGVDRVDMVGKVGLLGQALRVTRAGGVVVVLTTDQSAWDGALSPPARDLAPGRPLHPETWSLLLHRSGAVDVDWKRPVSGTVHAVVAGVAP
jgi:hypothetical protein